MNKAWWSTDRYIDIRASLMNGVNTVWRITSDEIIDYNIDSALDNHGVCIGSVTSSQFSLTITKDCGNRINLRNNYSRLEMYVEIAIYKNNAWQWTPFGRWKIEALDWNDFDTIITLTGTDLLSSAYDVTIKDTGTYNASTTWGQVFLRICNALDATPSPVKFLNFDTPISSISNTNVSYKQPIWWGGLDNGIPVMTLNAREMLKGIAQIAGGYCYVDFAGRLTIKSFKYDSYAQDNPIESDYLIDSYYDGNTFVYAGLKYSGRTSYTLNSGKTKVTDAAYGSLTIGDLTWKSGDTLVVEQTAPTDFFVDKNVRSSGTVSSSTTLENVHEMLLQFTDDFYGEPLEQGEFTWVGDPTIEVGSSVYAKLLSETDIEWGQALHFLVSNLHYEFNGGLSCRIESSLPFANDWVEENEYVVDMTNTQATMPDDDDIPEEVPDDDIPDGDDI